MRDWTIFLDMDGVCTDFVKGVLTLFDRMDLYGEVAGRLDAPGVLCDSKEAFWQRIDAAGIDFWRNLEPLPWYEQMYRELSALGNVVFLTSPGYAMYAASGKVAWLFDRFGYGFRDFILAPEKHHCDGPRKLLIDDFDKNVDRFTHSVLFPQPWNRAGKKLPSTAWPDIASRTLVVEVIIAEVQRAIRHAA